MKMRVLCAVFSLAPVLAGCSTALHRAAKIGRADKVAALLDKGADVNAYDRFGAMTCGYTPLMAAACRGQLETVKLLLDRGADINRNAEGCGWGPMEFALWCGHPEVAKFLFARGAEPTQGAINQAQWRGQPLLHHQLIQALERLKAGLPPAPAALPDTPKPATSDVDFPAYRRSEKPGDFAIVVGIEKYSNDLPAATFAQRDAEAVKRHLVALGVPERNIKVISDSRASRANLEAYLEDWLPRNVQPDSRVFFYFSGHGAPAPESGQAYLVPWDGNPSFIEKTGYSLSRLYGAFDALKAREIIVALDACFSGAGGRSVLAEGTRPLVVQVAMPASQSGKVVLFSATSPKETTSTLPDQGHGLFTYYFLKGLAEAKDPRGNVTFRSVFDYLNHKVQDAASRQNRDQHPLFEAQAGMDSGQF